MPCGLKKLMNDSKSAADGCSCRICSNVICHVATTEFAALGSRRRSPMFLLRRPAFFLSLFRNSSRYADGDIRGARRSMYAAACVIARGMHSSARTRSAATSSSYLSRSLFRSSCFAWYSSIAGIDKTFQLLPVSLSAASLLREVTRILPLLLCGKKAASGCCVDETVALRSWLLG